MSTFIVFGDSLFIIGMVSRYEKRFPKKSLNLDNEELFFQNSHEAAGSMPIVSTILDTVMVLIIITMMIEKNILVQILKLIVSIAICQCAGFIGSVFTMPAIPTWYASLKKPPFTPPNWLFAPAWLTLYVLMGIALFLVWRKGLDIPPVKVACIIFIVQLLLNTLWSICFFGLRSPFFGLVVIILLWIAVCATIVLFARIEPLASYLLVPYVIWLSYAALLNASIFILNRA